MELNSMFDLLNALIIAAIGNGGGEFPFGVTRLKNKMKEFLSSNENFSSFQVKDDYDILPNQAVPQFVRKEI